MINTSNDTPPSSLVAQQIVHSFLIADLLELVVTKELFHNENNMQSYVLQAAEDDGELIELPPFDNSIDVRCTNQQNFALVDADERIPLLHIRLDDIEDAHEFLYPSHDDAMSDLVGDFNSSSVNSLLAFKTCLLKTPTETTSEDASRSSSKRNSLIKMRSRNGCQYDDSSRRSRHSSARGLKADTHTIYIRVKNFLKQDCELRHLITIMLRTTEKAVDLDKIYFGDCNPQHDVEKSVIPPPRYESPQSFEEETSDDDDDEGYYCYDENNEIVVEKVNPSIQGFDSNEEVEDMFFGDISVEEVDDNGGNVYAYGSDI